MEPSPTRVDPWGHYAAPPALDPCRIAWNRPFFTPLERFYLRGFRHVHRPTRILEIGCGYARNLVHLTSTTTEFGLGLDVSATALQGAIRFRERFGGTSDTRFVCGALRTLHSGHFDVVVATQVINYYADPAQFFTELSEHLSSESCVILSDATRRPRSVSTVLKENGVLRALLRRGATPAVEDQVYYHEIDRVVAAASNVGLELTQVEWAGHWLHRLFGDELHEIARRRFSCTPIRSIVRTVYLTLARLTSLEDRLLREREGLLYLAVFRSGGAL